MEILDLLIIGSGPAGISTALHLLQKDSSWRKRMLIIEKSHHPRAKPCGGGVTTPGLLILRNLGFHLPLPIPQAPVTDAHFLYKNRLINVYGYPRFVVFQRPELDAYLAQEAEKRGIAIQQEEPAIELNPTPAGMVVTTERNQYLAQVVIGADGAKGITRRYVRKPGRPDESSESLRPDRPARIARSLEIITHANKIDPYLKTHYALFDFTPTRPQPQGEQLQGYAWVFPTIVNGQPYHNQGIYDGRLAHHRPKANLVKLLKNQYPDLTDAQIHNEIQGHPIHWFSPRNRFSTERLILVGEAAGVDPLFGEGIYPALGYGQVAGEAIQQAFNQQDFTFGNYRRQLLSSPIGDYLMLRWLIARIGYTFSQYGWFMHCVWTLGWILATLWPKGEPLYRIED